MPQVKMVETRVIRRNNVSTMLHRGQVYPYEKAMDPILAIGHAVLLDEAGAPASVQPADPPPAAATAPPPAKPQTLRRRPHPLQANERDIAARDPGPALRDPVRNGGFSEA